MSKDNQAIKPTIELKPASYQPSRAELEETFDMPGASPETIRDVFLSPVIIQRIKVE